MLLRPRAALSLLCTLLLLSACTDAPDAPPDAAADTDTTSLRGPATKIDTLLLEGTAEPVTLTRFDAPGAPFVTYVPEEMRGEVASSGEGTAVRFWAAFGGRENRDAYLHFFFPSSAQPLDGAEALAERVEAPQGLLATNGWQVLSRDTTRGAVPCPWATVRYRFTGGTGESRALGHVCVGAHAGEPYYLVVHFPAEYGDGFGPRAALLLSHLRWRDS